MSDEGRISDEDIADWKLRLGKIATDDTMIGAVIAEAQRLRAMERRLRSIAQREWTADEYKDSNHSLDWVRGWNDAVEELRSQMGSP